MRSCRMPPPPRKLLARLSPGNFRLSRLPGRGPRYSWSAIATLDPADTTRSAMLLLTQRLRASAPDTAAAATGTPALSFASCPSQLGVPSPNPRSVAIFSPIRTPPLPDRSRGCCGGIRPAPREAELACLLATAHRDRSGAITGLNVGSVRPYLKLHLRQTGALSQTAGRRCARLPSKGHGAEDPRRTCRGPVVSTLGLAVWHAVGLIVRLFGASLRCIGRRARWRHVERSPAARRARRGVLLLRWRRNRCMNLIAYFHG